ncbi:AsnC family transcriptional regulator [Sediminihabitans luteus]|nr:AsnC family transcriptional regulator [Sediminihabitans luteus]
MQDSDLDEADRRILHALQVRPRASWTLLGEVLGLDPATVARRWERLAGDGLAWVTAYPARLVGSDPAGALVELESRAGHVHALVDELAHDPQCLSIDVTAGSRDLLLTVAATDQTALAEYLVDRLGRMRSIRSIRSQIVAEVLADASTWRLRALDPETVARLEEPAPPLARRATTPLEQSVVAELAADGRVSATALAGRLGVSERRARDTLRTVLHGHVRLRTEVTRAVSGWPVNAWYFLRVPAAQAQRVGTELGRVEEVRTVMSTIGSWNIAVGVWLRTLTDVQRLESTLEARLPGVVIVDRSTVLRTAKIVGTVLDASGRRTARVAIPVVR